MKQLLPKFIFIFCFLVLFGCGSGVGSSENGLNEYLKNLTEDQLKMQLLNIECSKGRQYLDGTLSSQPIYQGLLSTKVNGLKLTCELTNSSVLATLKDIVLKVEFKSKTGTTIWEEEVIVYEFIEPRGKVKIKTEIACTDQQYKDISDMSWIILSATCK